jgi:hypothetical protein
LLHRTLNAIHTLRTRLRRKGARVTRLRAADVEPGDLGDSDRFRRLIRAVQDGRQLELS